VEESQKRCSVAWFWLRPVWSLRRRIYATLRYQLVALATYLRFAPVSVGRYGDLSSLRSGSQIWLIAARGAGSMERGAREALKTYRLKNYKLKASSGLRWNLGASRRTQVSENAFGERLFDLVMTGNGFNGASAGIGPKGMIGALSLEVATSAP